MNETNLNASWINGSEILPERMPFLFVINVNLHILSLHTQWDAKMLQKEIQKKKRCTYWFTQKKRDTDIDGHETNLGFQRTKFVKAH